VKTFPNGHEVKRADRKRIPCDGVDNTKPCGKPARFCEYMRWSFFYFCAKCWRTPGPNGTSPEQRAGRN
jgi:hypothetical protein